MMKGFPASATENESKGTSGGEKQCGQQRVEEKRSALVMRYGRDLQEGVAKCWGGVEGKKDPAYVIRRWEEKNK